jgi:hypothetical protein
VVRVMIFEFPMEMSWLVGLAWTKQTSVRLSARAFELQTQSNVGYPPWFC